jgi:hypothetical protein
MDFNATAFTVTYPADEGVYVPRISAFIDITDDDVNEAREQTFIVFLEIVDAVSLDLLTITRSNSPCVIVDNDGKGRSVIGYDLITTLTLFS